MAKVPKTTDKTKLKLKVLDRIVIRRLFPQESNLMNQIMARDIDEKIKITQKELTDMEMKQTEGQMRWSPEKDKGKFVEFTDAEVEFLKKQIEGLDKKSKITSDMLDICLKIRDIKSEK